MQHDSEGAILMGKVYRPTYKSTELSLGHNKNSCISFKPIGCTLGYLGILNLRRIMSIFRWNLYSNKCNVLISLLGLFVRCQYED